MGSSWSKRMVKAVKAGDLDGLQTIIQRARSHRLFDIGKVIDRKGNTLLHLACLYEEFDTVRCLLDLKANANARNNLGNAPLHLAAGCRRLKTVKYLVENAKADIETRNKKGQTPLHIARGMGYGQVEMYFEQTLRSKKFDIEVFDEAVRSGRTQDVAQLLLSVPSSFNIDHEVDKEGNTCLHVACREGDFKMAKLLLDAKATYEARRRDGKTPFLTACAAGQLSMVMSLSVYVGGVRALDYDGNGAVHYACYKGFYPLARYLVKYLKLSTETVNKKGQTPLDVALRMGNLKIADYLKEEKSAYSEEEDNITTGNAKAFPQVKSDPKQPTSKHLEQMPSILPISRSSEEVNLGFSRSS
ncbi:hypothetical protein AAMO2058_000618500 [Amorphochlora amoebiformis]